MYDCLIAMQSTTSSLHNITRLMNMPVEVRQKFAAWRANDVFARAEQAKGDVGLDDLPIRASEVIHSYRKKQPLPLKSFDIRQGTLEALVGPRGEGKTTLLKLLAGVVFPS